jgi:phage terminase large subunit GpA-like protein
METFADNRVRTLSIMCSAQSAKTETMIACLCWLIAEDPGPTMWVTSNEDEALKFAKERLMPSLRACPLVSHLIPKDRNLAKTKEIYFPHMTLEIVGSNAPSKLQSKPRRWLLLDEVRNWPSGALPMVLKRTRTFWNARQVIISTPDNEHDTVHQEYLRGNQQVWKVKCPKCSGEHELSWEFMKWDSDERTKPGGKYNFDALADTIRMSCPACSYETWDTPAERRRLIVKGDWVELNPDAPSSRKSFTWNALLPTWVKWRELVEEFLSAKKALSWGDPAPLKAFICESLGQPWEDRLRFGDQSNWAEDRKGSYKLLDKWPDEERRFLSADVQKDCLYYTCRAFGKGGSSRLLDYGKIPDFSSLREKITELEVDEDDVVIDSGYQATSVYNEVTKSGYAWKPMKGDDFQHFVVDGVRQPYKDTLVDPAMGTALQGQVRPVRLFVFSNPSIKDLLAEYKRGIGPSWQIPENVTMDYVRQMSAEHREELEDAYGKLSYKWVNRPRKDNHYWDCECMTLVAALVTGAIGVT